MNRRGFSLPSLNSIAVCIAFLFFQWVSILLDSEKLPPTHRMALSGSASSPSGYQSVDDAAALLAEVADEEHVLEEFYSFMYEDAVLVGAHPANPRTDGGDCSRSPTRAFSPKRGEGSPRKNLISEPPATSLAATAPLAAPSTLTREILNAMLPPK